MIENQCDNLDAFLSEDLPPAAAVSFTAHLVECEPCREALDEQRWIDGLLRSPWRIELESPPAALIERVRQPTSQRRRHVRSIACGLAAAAALAVAFGWTVLTTQQPLGPAAIVISDAVVTSVHEPRRPEPPRATFVGGPDVLVVPVESRHPDVTVVRVYPVYQPDYAAQASAVAPAATDDFTWPLDLNGG